MEAPKNYVGHLTPSSEDVIASLNEVGLDFSRWPQAVVPEHILQPEIERYNQWFAQPPFIWETPAMKTEEYRIQRIAEMRVPRAIISRPWGLIEGSQQDSYYWLGFHATRAWGSKNVEQYRSVCWYLLNPLLCEFNSGNGFPKRMHRGTDIEIEDGFHEIIFTIRYDFEEDSETEKPKKIELIRAFLVKILTGGTLDRLMEASCSEEVDVHGRGHIILGFGNGKKIREWVYHPSVAGAEMPRSQP